MEDRRLRSDACPNSPLQAANWRCPLAFNRYTRLLRLRMARHPCPAPRQQVSGEESEFDWERQLAAQVFAEHQFLPGTSVLPCWTGEWVRLPASQLPGGHLWAYAPTALPAWEGAADADSEGEDEGEDEAAAMAEG